MAKLPQSTKKGKTSSPPQAMPSSHVEPRCKVCKHPQRLDMDRALALGWSQQKVLEHWNAIEGGDKPYFTPNNISIHRRKHMNYQDEAYREIFEQQALREGIDIDKIKGFIITQIGMANSITLKGWEAVLQGTVPVLPGDMLKAMEFVNKLEEQRQAFIEDEMLRELRCFFEAVEELVPEEQFDIIYERFEEKLERKSLAAPREPEDPDTVIGEAEEITDGSE